VWFSVLACLPKFPLEGEIVLDSGVPEAEDSSQVEDSDIVDTSVEDRDGDGVPDDQDCDPDDADIRPGAEEHCDGVDEDCDGAVDEGAVDAGVWYLDSDGDGFGFEPAEGCEQPSDTTEKSGDCDDSDASVHPDADEVCFDEVDNDCDGAIDETDAGCTLLEVSGGDCFDLAVALGSPTSKVEVQVTVLSGVTITCSTTSLPALSTGSLPEGSRVLLVNDGTIHGHGGDGACSEAGTGESGGDAIQTTVELVIENNGGIYGGGGGGGSGDDPTGGGGGAGGGNGCDGGGNSSGGIGGNGATRWETIPGGNGDDFDGSAGTGGSKGNPPTGGGGGSGGGAQSFGTDSGEGQGGAGGGWGGGGGGGGGIREDRNIGNGGDAGYGVRVLSGSVTFTAGDDTDHLKGLAQ